MRVLLVHPSQHSERGGDRAVPGPSASTRSAAGRSSTEGVRPQARRAPRGSPRRTRPTSARSTYAEVDVALVAHPVVLRMIQAVGHGVVGRKPARIIASRSVSASCCPARSGQDLGRPLPVVLGEPAPAHRDAGPDLVERVDHGGVVGTHCYEPSCCSWPWRAGPPGHARCTPDFRGRRARHPVVVSQRRPRRHGGRAGSR